MPCNAFGHPPTCECGWGGLNYDPWKPRTITDWSCINSHINPNARCPVCQNKVFFYRSPDGGTVFFDELGPPWPKHPCTRKDFKYKPPESISPPDPTPFSKREQKRNKKKKTKKHPPQWWPYPSGSVETLPDNEGLCILGEDNKRLFTDDTTINITARTPIWIRKIPETEGKYEISTFILKNEKIKIINSIGYSAQGVLGHSTPESFKRTRERLMDARRNQEKSSKKNRKKDKTRINSIKTK